MQSLISVVWHNVYAPPSTFSYLLPHTGHDTHKLFRTWCTTQEEAALNSIAIGVLVAAIICCAAILAVTFFFIMKVLTKHRVAGCVLSMEGQPLIIRLDGQGIIATVSRWRIVLTLNPTAPAWLTITAGLPPHFLMLTRTSAAPFVQTLPRCFKTPGGPLSTYIPHMCIFCCSPLVWTALHPWGT